MSNRTHATVRRPPLPVPTEGALIALDLAKRVEHLHSELETLWGRTPRDEADSILEQQIDASVRELLGKLWEQSRMYHLAGVALNPIFEDEPGSVLGGGEEAGHE